MTAETEVVQDFFNTLGIHGTLKWPVNVVQFAAAADSLREMGGDKSTHPKHIMQCIDQMCRAVGPYFRQLFDTPADVDDLWVHYWCPQAGDLSKADCPAGTIPLWTNGESTVFARSSKSAHGNEEFNFAVC